MDRLGKRANKCAYTKVEDFATDIRLIFDNAILYNKDDMGVSRNTWVKVLWNYSDLLYSNIRCLQKPGTVYEAAQYLLKKFNIEFQQEYDLYQAQMAQLEARREATAAAASSSGAPAGKLLPELHTLQIPRSNISF